MMQLGLKLVSFSLVSSPLSFYPECQVDETNGGDMSEHFKGLKLELKSEKPACYYDTGF